MNSASGQSRGIYPIKLGLAEELGAKYKPKMATTNQKDFSIYDLHWLEVRGRDENGIDNPILSVGAYRKYRILAKK